MKTPAQQLGYFPDPLAAREGARDAGWVIVDDTHAIGGMRQHWLCQVDDRFESPFIGQWYWLQGDRWAWNDRTLRKTDDRVVLYRIVDAKWTDPWGHTHPAKRVKDVTVVHITGTPPKNNGYEDYQAACGSDDQGAHFWHPRTIDYWGTSAWFTDDYPETRWWQDRIPPKERIIDSQGNPLTNK